MSISSKSEYLIPESVIHSVADIITNSSTEIFIAALPSSVDTIKTLINNLLSVSGGNLTCDDLFEISITGTESYHEYFSESSIMVKAKNPDLEETARILSNLTSLFSINAEYNG